MKDPLLVVATLCCLSLGVAFVVFHILRSFAIVKTSKYQAGGGLAGFVIVFGLLGGMHYRLSGQQQRTKEQDQQIQDLKDKLTKAQTFIRPRDIAGTVNPYSSGTKVLLAFTEADLPVNKKFRLSVPCVDLAYRQYAVYVMKEGKHYSYDLFPNEDLSKLEISLPQ